MIKLVLSILVLLLAQRVGAEPIFQCDGSNCTKAVKARHDWMKQRADEPYSYQCIDATEKNYKIIPCDFPSFASVTINPDSCEQRMREAMRNMAPYFRSYNENKAAGLDFKKQHEQYESVQQHWNQTMRECVK